MDNSNMCMHCLMIPTGEQKLQVCGRCKNARYCSRDCQTQHWTAHKKSCKDNNNIDSRSEKHLAKAEAYQENYNYKKSAKYYNKVLKDHKKTDGIDAYATLKTIGALAGTYFDQGNYKKSELMYKDLLQRSIALYGEMDHCTLTTANNLCGVLKALGQFEEAEVLLEDCVKKSKIIHGELAEDTLNTINNLASVYRVRCKFSSAIDLLKDVVKKYQSMRGKNTDDEDTLKAMNNLANCYQTAGTELDKAEELFKIIISKRSFSLGENHPLTTMTKLNLGNVYTRMGKYHLAEPLVTGACEKSSKVLGKSHPDTLSCRINLAALHDAKEEYEIAETILIDTLKKFSETVGLNNALADQCSQFLKSVQMKKMFNQGSNPFSDSIDSITKQFLAMKRMDRDDSGPDK